MNAILPGHFKIRLGYAMNTQLVRMIEKASADRLKQQSIVQSNETYQHFGLDLIYQY